MVYGFYSKIIPLFLGRFFSWNMEISFLKMSLLLVLRKVRAELDNLLYKDSLVKLF